MALDDRHYMQDPQGPAHTPSGGLFDLSSMWLKLVVLNLVIYLAYQPNPGIRDFLTTHFMVSASRLSAGLVWTLVTSAFLHVGFAHLFWNMLFLVLFARHLEALYGGRNLVALYLFAAVVAALTQLPFLPTSEVEVFGASGAIMGIVVTTALFFPHRKIVVFPLWSLVALFLLFTLSGMVWTYVGSGDGVAYGAHLGGALAGALFKVLDLRPFGPKTPEEASLGPGLLARLRRAPKRSGAPKRRAPAAPRDASPPDSLTSEVDDVLRKINRDGIDSLTDEERALLEKASQTYRSGGQPRP